ncbi:helix-turn-helix domain-containing protein [Rhodopseudomonas palustris]|uniref:Transcriptional regulator n=1 Tax=Rhodopseudomonas palustris TaxID=1076 RepID=A0A418V4D2_RHOPL|nr:transcriptional regulator [Rhodopseudomonas palustris]
MSSPGWHRADIVAAIHKRGTSLAALARQNGLGDATLRAALSYPRTPSNTIIANYLRVPLHELWPDWFDRKGRLLGGDRKPRQPRASSQKRRRKLRAAAGGCP